MNALNIFFVILVIGGNVGNILSGGIVPFLVPSAPEHSDTIDSNSTAPPPEKPFEPESPSTPQNPTTSNTQAPGSGSPSGSSVPGQSTTESMKPDSSTSATIKCCRNSNGMCKTTVDCEKASLESKIEWRPTHLLDCAHRGLDEVKVCSVDCENVFRIGRCPSTLNPVCGFSIKTGKCKKFANPCLLKQDACRYPSIKDWRITHLAACNYLRIGGAEGACI